MHPWADLAKTSTSMFTIWAQSRRTRISHSVCVSAALYHRGVRGRHFPLWWIWPIRGWQPRIWTPNSLHFAHAHVGPSRTCMVRTSKTDHFFKLAPFWSPLTDLIDFDMAGKLLTSATRRCSPFVDSVSRIWIKPKNHWLAVGLQRLQPLANQHRREYN